MQMIRMCCVCKKIWSDVLKKWIDAQPFGPVTHAFCPECLQKEYAKINESNDKRSK